MGTMVRRFTEKTFRTVGSQVTSLLAVAANDGLASVCEVAGLMTMAASARLTFISEVN